MKPLVQPPQLEPILQSCSFDILTRVYEVEITHQGRYLHWDKMRHLSPPPGLTHEQWWLGTRLARRQQSRRVPLLDLNGQPFVYTLPDCILAKLHAIDSLASGRLTLGAQVATEENRDRFIFNSLVEEAITSSQLEGASTTRQVAADMIRYQRKPRDKSERMILNNYLAMQSVRDLREQPLDYAGLMALHRTLTDATLEHADAAGRIQQPGEQRVEVVDHLSHRSLYSPPPATGLRERVEALIAFANGDAADASFIHPVVRAIIMHFWLAWLHPFEDGNGRTARALFYRAMLHHGYWLFEFISISRILKQAPARYTRAFLETESDGNDLTYFLIHQLGVIEQALAELEDYLARKADQLQQVERLLKHSDLNHRQIALLSHAVRHPGQEYTVKSHQISHRIAYATARADLLQLAEMGLLFQRRIGRKTLEFIASEDLEERINALQR